MMVEIPLTRGLVATIDAEDVDLVTGYRWYAAPGNRDLFYALTRIREGGVRRTVMMHRLINRTAPGLQTDHINGNTLDNRRSNLRTVTRAQNMWNRRADLHGSSSFRGVSWQAKSGKWLAMIQANKSRQYLGLFADERDAARAYQSAAERLFGNFNRRQQI